MTLDWTGDDDNGWIARRDRTAYTIMRASWPPDERERFEVYRMDRLPDEVLSARELVNSFSNNLSLLHPQFKPIATIAEAKALAQADHDLRTRSR